MKYTRLEKWLITLAIIVILAMVFIPKAYSASPSPLFWNLVQGCLQNTVADSLRFISVDGVDTLVILKDGTLHHNGAVVGGSVEVDSSTIVYDGSNKLAVATSGITATHLATNSVGADEIALGAVGSTEIANDGVQDVDIDWGTGLSQVSTDDMPQGSTNKYNQTHTGDVTGSTALTIANNAVDTAHFNDAEVTQYIKLRDAGDIDTTQSNFSTTTQIGKYIDNEVNDLTLENVTVRGDFDITGYNTRWQVRSNFDTANLKFVLKDDDKYLNYRIPVDHYTSPTDSSNRYDAVHPSVVYVPQGLFGYKYHMVFTPTFAAGEDPTYRVSNDNYNWYQFISGTDSCPDPIWIADNCTSSTHGIDKIASYLSDAKLSYSADGYLRCYFRATFAYSGDTATEFALYVSKTENGYTWSNPLCILGPDSINSMISPSVKLDSNSTYKMWAVCDTGVVSGSDHHAIVLLYESAYADSGFTLTDTCDWLPFYNADVSTSTAPRNAAETTLYNVGQLWHLDIDLFNKDEYVAVVTVYNSYFPLYVAKSRDGINWETRTTPILDPYNDSRIFATYKSGFIWVDNGNGRTMGLYYTADSAQSIQHPRLYYTEGFFFDTTYRYNIEMRAIDKESDNANTEQRLNYWHPGTFTQILALDSNTTGSSTIATDTLMFVGYAPVDMYLDTMKFTARTSHTSNKINSIYMYKSVHTVLDSGFINMADGTSGAAIWGIAPGASTYAVANTWRRFLYKFDDTGSTLLTGSDSAFVHRGDQLIVRMILHLQNNNYYQKFANLQVSGWEAWRNRNATDFMDLR